jgi:hypothetical protein
MRSCRLIVIGLTILAASSLASCNGEPPNREMQQAQEAIEAARSAGAADYAADELSGAVDALKRSHEAAEVSDYRLALNNAIDARERAQAAARLAGKARESARSDANRAVADLTAALAESQARLKSSESSRVPVRRLAEPRKAVAAVERDLQEARTLFERGDYPTALARASAARVVLEGVSRDFDAIFKPPTRGRR